MLSRSIVLALPAVFSILQARAADDRDIVGEGPSWIAPVSASAGMLQNTTRLRIKVPQGSSGTTTYQEQEIELADRGYGGGLTTVGFVRQFSFTNILFWFPDVNQSRVVGSVSTFSMDIPTKTPVDLYIGTGFAYVGTNTDYRNFNYALRQSLYDRMAIGYASFPRMVIDNSVIAPYPKLGIKIPIPIQHWYITPFYSYMYEWVATHAQSDGGHVSVYYEGDREQGLPSQLEINVPAFDKPNNKEYASHLAAANFLFDFHYFLQLRGFVYYNLSHDLFTARLIGSVMFNRYFGISAYFEYTEKITVTNTYFLIGPSFIFGPQKFFDALLNMRKGKP